MADTVVSQNLEEGSICCFKHLAISHSHGERRFTATLLQPTPESGIERIHCLPFQVQ